MISGKGLLIAMTIGAAGVVYIVHYQQIRDKNEMHKGVIRDRERVAAKKLAKQSSTSSSK
jgi:hypothetical protein